MQEVGQRRSGFRKPATVRPVQHRLDLVMGQQAAALEQAQGSLAHRLLVLRCNPFVVGELACGNLRQRLIPAGAAQGSAPGHGGH
jgi:hypothetical protein